MKLHRPLSLRVITLLLAASIALPLLAQNPPPPPAADAAAEVNRLTVFNEKQLVAWWQAHPDAASWHDVAGDQLLPALQHAEERYGVDRVFENEHFRNWLIHCRWLNLFPKFPDQHGYFSDSAAQDIFRQLSLRGQQFPGLLIRSLDPGDDAEKALEILCRIAAADPENAFRYPQLAVALAVVFDQPFPDTWPHPFVAQGDLPKFSSTPAEAAVERFTFCMTSIAAGQFHFDPAKLSVRDLTFAVDSPLHVDELRYIQQVELKRGPASLTELYPAIRYDVARANRGEFRWPHGNYALFEIGKRGGICADQAHFVAHTGKSKGIPTLFFFGQGRSGGHAWVGYLERPGKWELNVARFAGENYPVGVAWDPQTWRRLTDAQFRILVKDMVANQRYEMLQLILQWAGLNHDRPSYRPLLHQARRFMPAYLSTWELEADYLQKNNSDLKTMDAFWRQWVANFREESDLRIRGQIELLGLYRNNGEDRAAERLEREIQLENKSERFDLAITVAAGTIFQAIDRHDWEAAGKEFESSLKRFRSNSGGHLFYNLVRPYIERCLEAGRATAARAALQQAAETFQAQANSLLDQDMKALRSVVEAVAK